MAAFPKSDHQLVRDYITAVDHLQYTQLPADIVAIVVTHSNLTAKHPDIRLDLHLTIQAVKERLHKHIGTPPSFQRLLLKQNGNTICELADDNKMLGFYSVLSGMEIHVIDSDPYSLSRGGGLTDTSLVEKYRLSDEAYDKRKGTMRDYIRQQREKDPNYKLKEAKGPKAGAPKKESSESDEPPAGPETVTGITVGDRCQVMPGVRRGVVAFVGPIEQLKPGYWVGVRFDEPVGKSEGVAKGVRIFDCEPNYGAFVKGKNVTVGDFPVRDIMDSDGEGEGDEKEGGKIDEEEEEDEI